MQPDPPPPPPTLESGAFGTPLVAVFFLHFVSCHRNVTWIPGAALSKGWIFVTWKILPEFLLQLLSPCNDWSQSTSLPQEMQFALRTIFRVLLAVWSRAEAVFCSWERSRASPDMVQIWSSTCKCKKIDFFMDTIHTYTFLNNYYMKDQVINVRMAVFAAN